MNISISVYNKDNEQIVTANADDFVCLVCNRTYEEGDYISVDFPANEDGMFLDFRPDDAMQSSIIFVKESFKYYIPFGEKRRAISQRVFMGDLHYISVEVPVTDYSKVYRDVALNPADQHNIASYYPHAFANAETRGESVFEARNAIDGIRSNRLHNDWPGESWGINMQDDAWWQIDFGRKVKVDMIHLFTRADFPHDNWWTNITVTFSDGREMKFDLEKSYDPHILKFEPVVTESLRLSNLIKSDDPSPFPALTEIEIYGTDM